MNKTPQNLHLHGRNIVAGYGAETILNGVNISIPQGKITALIGPNGCGKSTLLSVLGRQLPTQAGQVEIAGRAVYDIPAREFARYVSFLPQQPLVPEGITVRDLVGFGRYSHTGKLAGLTATDHTAIEAAAQRTGITELLDEQAAHLSGGQRQRVWIAMTIAQEAPILLLDEPTTYLDPAHQLSILDLVKSLNAQGKTIVMVLHDMTQAARYADHIIAMKNGSILAEGRSKDVLTAETVGQVFGVRCLLVQEPTTGRMLPVPYSLYGSTDPSNL